jgi:hypothetical protein
VQWQALGVLGVGLHVGGELTALLVPLALVGRFCCAALGGSSRFVVNGPAEEGVHAAVFAALASRIRVR